MPEADAKDNSNLSDAQKNSVIEDVTKELLDEFDRFAGGRSLTAIYENDHINDREQAVLLYLGHCAGFQTNGFVKLKPHKIETIAKKTRISPNTARAAVKSLCEKKYVRKVERFAANGAQLTTEYALTPLIFEQYQQKWLIKQLAKKNINNYAPPGFEPPPSEFEPPPSEFEPPPSNSEPLIILPLSSSPSSAIHPLPSFKGRKEEEGSESGQPTLLGEGKSASEESSKKREAEIAPHPAKASSASKKAAAANKLKERTKIRPSAINQADETDQKILAPQLTAEIVDIVQRVVEPCFRNPKTGYIPIKQLNAHFAKLTHDAGFDAAIDHALYIRKCFDTTYSELARRYLGAGDKRPEAFYYGIVDLQKLMRWWREELANDDKQSEEHLNQNTATDSTEDTFDGQNSKLLSLDDCPV